MATGLGVWRVMPGARVGKRRVYDLNRCAHAHQGRHADCETKRRGRERRFMVPSVGPAPA